jgi:nuclear pore complex protein Nup93
LVREFTDTEAVPFERYRLADVQNRVSSYGSEYFDREASNPWIYFKILLMTLQFEKAIDYLYKQKRLRLETVHFSIGLVYHGLLRVPQTSKLFASSICKCHNSIKSLNAKKFVVIQEGNTHMLDWVRLVYQYVQVYLANDAKKALEYISLFSLYSPKQGYHDQGMIQLAKSYTCKYTMASKEFKAILGSVDDKKIVSQFKF